MKDPLRNDILEKRKAFSSVEVMKKSILIKKRLFLLPEFLSAKTVLFYVSYDNEVFTHEMIKHCLLLGKKVVVPCTDVKKKQLVLSELHRWEDLTTCVYNILEPKPECRYDVSFDKIDLVVVPGVVFDCAGQRIGHGHGYYDRLLRKAPDVLKIGLAFEFQLVDKIPAEKHDVCVNKIITEKRVICCLS